ncbi:class II aldolase/adducin family protein [Lichenihabitans psoromatis]|uniref:class II aldolase/adducin family protein n=1 Tax=Lichenihabitans psoromatis TaxID=2528642 RepID=UPI0010384EFC|nr:class II aldolase/adducin family protein [Lichenihabitans psoromatis]
MMQLRETSPESLALAALAVRVGSDPSLVQGPGGNVSIKIDGVLWVKASGTWLAEAETRDIMVPVALEPLLDALKRNDPACETSVDFVRQDLNDNKLRPSIETTLHAVLPQRIVVHVHCVETLAHAVRSDVRDRVAAPLAGLPYVVVPYARPGVPLTQAIVAELKPDTTILVLANHGLVVAADTVEEADALLTEVVRRLRVPKKPASPADDATLAALANGTTYEIADAALHGLGVEAAACRLAAGGSLYPDHVIFLGPSIITSQPGESVAEAIARSGRNNPPMLVVPGAGVLFRTDATPAMRALGGCLADVMSRLPADAPLAYLTHDDEAALLGWDAEKYRQALDRTPT